MPSAQRIFTRSEYLDRPCRAKYCPRPDGNGAPQGERHRVVCGRKLVAAGIAFCDVRTTNAPKMAAARSRECDLAPRVSLQITPIPTGCAPFLRSNAPASERFDRALSSHWAASYRNLAGRHAAS